MTRSFVLAAMGGLLFGIVAVRFAQADEPKATGTVDINSSVPNLEKLQAFEGTGVILGQKEWERLAAAWGIKDVPKVDFSKELLLIGTWRGTAFKFLSEVKNGDLQVELVGDKNVEAGFRYRIVSLSRAGITKFQGKDLPALDTSSVGEPKPIPTELKAERPTVALSGDILDEKLQQAAPVAGVIVSQKGWDMLVKAWGLKDVPKVDFNKELLVVGTWRGTIFDLTPVVTKGDLSIVIKGTKDLAPGFRWMIVSVKREGIKTLQSKELPRE
jgi:hypothetical protein